MHEGRVAAAKLLTQARIRPDGDVWALIASWVPQFDGWAIADHAMKAAERRLIADPARLFDCDLFLFTASRGVPPVGTPIADVRMAQYRSNAALLKPYARAARESGFTGLFCQISDPVDQLSRVVFLESNRAPDGTPDLGGLLPEQVRKVNAVYVQDMGKTDWDHPQSAWIDARSAIYVRGSKRKGSMGPTFASFGSEADARQFVAQYGGEWLRMPDIKPEMVDLRGGANLDSRM